MSTPVLRSLGLIVLLTTSGVAGACARCDRDGPVENAAERAGEAVDDAADEAEDAVD